MTESSPSPEPPRLSGRRLWQMLVVFAALATLVTVPAGTERRLLAVIGYLSLAAWIQFGTRPVQRDERIF